MGYTWEYEVKVYKYTLILALILAGLAAVFTKNSKPLIYGLVFGTLISMLNFRSLAMTLEKAVTMPPAQAQVYAGSRYFIRFLTNGVVLFVSIKGNHINVVGTIIGLFLIKLVIMGTNLFSDKLFYKRIFIRKEEK